MSLKASIIDTYQSNTNYQNPGQAVNQASSLSALSTDLYTDSKRFIYELLQNADDAAISGTYVKVWIKLIDNFLVVAHSGKIFTERDIVGICNVNNGTKKSDISKTGYKGIGFKSVFGQSDNVAIYTNGEYFRFDRTFDFGWHWKEEKTKWEKRNDRSFQYPWQIIPIYTEKEEIDQLIRLFVESIGATVATIIELNNVKETSQAVKSLPENINMFIFLKNIDIITFEIEEEVSVHIDRETKHRTVLSKGDKIESSWLIKTVDIDVPEEVKNSLVDERNIPEKLITTPSIEISFATKIENGIIKNLSKHEKLLYSYLPTDENKYSLPVLVNTSFMTTANRESLHVDSRWNQWIFEILALEIFRWIAQLVKSDIKSQAYDLIPEKTFNDELGGFFNKGIAQALETIPFVVSRSGEMMLVKDSIVDFTYLSEKSFVGYQPVLDFVLNKFSIEDKSDLGYACYSSFFYKFKKLGTKSFEWNDIGVFLETKYFTESHTASKNIELVKYFKKICESEKVSKLTDKNVKDLKFILDHRNSMNYPWRVCLPTPDDKNWNNSSNQLSFVHGEVQEWLLANYKFRLWLENLGLTEKTDVTYIEQNIIPNIETFITKDNAIITVRELFNLYKSESLNKSLLSRLKRLRLLTTNETLLPAEECYLSEFYNPRILMEDSLALDLYVSELYCTSAVDKSEWKHFLLQLGVSEGFKPLVFSNKVSLEMLKRVGFKENYFRDKKFTPFVSTFVADEYIDLITVNYIEHTIDNYEFARILWKDLIHNYDPSIVDSEATAFWGHVNKAGRNSGDLVKNYVLWFIGNYECIPTVNRKCCISTDVFLNHEDIIRVAGNYMPVFDGPELSADWRAFFQFETEFILDDYLMLLKAISNDTDDKGNVKGQNIKRIQLIYSVLLKDSANWSCKDFEEVRLWAEENRLLNSKNSFTACNELLFFIDGNENIFQEEYCFLYLNAKNKNSPNLVAFLECFGVKIIEQSEFKLINLEKEQSIDLIKKVKKVLPYFNAWIDNDIAEDVSNNRYNEMKDRIDKIEIYEADDLKITYEGIDFLKKVNVHYNNSELFVTRPWTANSVLLKLPEILCRILEACGNDKKLDFLLRSDDNEIRMYFVQEHIEIPEYLVKIEPEVKHKRIKTFSDIESAVLEKKISPEFFHLSSHDYNSLKYIEKLIPRAVENIMNYLNGLPNYDCSNSYEIADSIIGGVKKNGNEITIVARPSDDEKVLIYYTAEFDVLEYVDAELWCEDGIATPKQITFGNLLRKTGINRIPVKNVDFSVLDIDEFLSGTKSDEFDFDIVPYTPQKLSKLIAAFANTSGGTVVFGIKELYSAKNELIGLSSDFQVIEITKKAISMLSSIPMIKYDWRSHADKTIFIIEVESADNDVLVENQKYVRSGADTILVNQLVPVIQEFRTKTYKRTIAVIISIEDYAKRDSCQIPPVKYANIDAKKFKETLIDKMDVDPEDVYMIMNHDALKSTLDYEFRGLFNMLTENDRLVFYYVGHGFHDGISNYLSTYDMHPYNIAETAVSLNRLLLEPLKRSKCENALIFIDACAQSYKHENMRNHISNIVDEEITLTLNEFPYYALFLSCQVGESSYSSNVLKHGIWTYHLLEVLNGSIQECKVATKYITDRSLSDYLSDKVPEYVKNELGYNQNPKIIIDTSHENVIVEFDN